MLKEIFAWWTGNTWGTRLGLWLAGAERVGVDEFGNTYYRSGTRNPSGKRAEGQRERRWVTYKNESEASLIPPLWHGWMHHQTDEAPSEQFTGKYPWQRPHQSNLTGTPQAYRPPGSIVGKAVRPKAMNSYEPWQP